MPRFFLFIKGLFVLGLLFFLSPTLSHGAEIHIPALEAAAGNTVSIPVMMDKAVDLAGVKLTIEYDQKILTFQKAAKTKETSSLMHIVNAKKPGRLIIVMAGARGITAENFAILNLEFKVGSDIKETSSTEIKISGVQLMNSALKNINCKTRSLPLVISLADKTAPKSGDK